MWPINTLAAALSINNAMPKTFVQKTLLYVPIEACFIMSKTRICSVRSRSRTPDTRLQAQIGSAEPGPGDPGGLSAAGCLMRCTSGAQRTQIWSALELPIGLWSAGGLVRKGRRMELVWRRGEGGKLREWGSRGRRHCGR